MERTEILSKLRDIFRDVLDNEEITLAETTSANDIEEWDSLANVQLIVEVESEFGIRFTSTEIMSWKNIGDWISCIDSKI